MSITMKGILNFADDSDTVEVIAEVMPTVRARIVDGQGRRVFPHAEFETEEQAYVFLANAVPDYSPDTGNYFVVGV